jgi:hypothetical protein
MDTQSFASATNSDYQTKWNNLQTATISNVMSQVFNKPAYIDRNLIYSNTFDRNESVTLSTDITRFYGYKIEVSDKKNIAFALKNLRFEGVGSGDIVIELFHSSQLNAIKTKTVTLVNDGTIQMVDVDWYIDMSLNYYKGSFMVGYYIANVDTFVPYKRNFNNAININDISELCISRIENVGDFSAMENIIFSNDHNGLNFDITVYTDYTDLIIQNKFIFSKAIQLHWALSVLLSAISSNRSNRNERFTKDMLNMVLLTIEGQRGFGMQKVVGIREQANGEIGRLQQEIKSIIDGYFTQEIVNVTVC